MIRRLLLLCALVAFASESAYGVELGKLQLHSALNQRLDADIPLTNVEGLGPDEILAGLASSDEFDKMGIDRPFALTNLRFTVGRGQNGQMSVHITSTKPIVEPYLDFLMEVLWPNGRIVREYTVLLDPPTFGKKGIEQLNAPSAGSSGSTASAPAPSSQMQPPAPQPTPAPQPKPAPQPAAQPVPEPAPMVSHMEEGNLANGKYGVTGPGDTLWKIAMKVRPNDSVSIQQTMLAIKRANEDDFIHDNINLLRAGRVLRIPDLSAMQQVSTAAAVAQVKVENDAFHTYKSTGSMPQINASPRNSQGQGAGGGNGSSGELRLLTARNTRNAQAAASSGNKAASGQALEDQLDTTRENLDKAKRANSELNSKVSDLQAQITTLNNLVKLKDQQMAALQASLRKSNSQQPAQQPAQAQPKPQPAQAPQPQQRQAQQAQPKPRAQPPKPANAASSPVVTVPKRQSFVQSLLTQPYVLIALGVLLIALLAGGLIFMRRRGSDEMEVEFDDEEGDEALDDDITLIRGDTPALDQNEVQSQTSDVMSDADIFIAYSQFGEASSLLKNAIAAEPDRADLRLKLLEVYIQTGDDKAFDEEVAAIDALGDAAASQQAHSLKSHMSGGLDLGGDDETEIALGLDDDDEPAVALASGGDDDDLSFDLDDLDAENDDTTLDLSMDDTADSDDGVELSLDDSDLELDLASDADDTGDLEELDLDLAADSDDTSEELGADESLSLDDDEFELNLDEDASTKLDLARAYIDMGDNDGARTVLQEVIEEGSDNEIQEANELLAKID